MEILNMKYLQKCELDKNGNWIKKTDYINELVDSTVERKIEYY